MADAQIIVRAQLRGERELNKARRKLLEIGAAAQVADKRMSGLASSVNQSSQRLTQAGTKYKKHFDDLDKMVKKFGGTIVGGFKMTSKIFIGEMALMSAAMVGMHGLLVVGQGLVKAYHGALQLAAGGAAGAAVALSAVAAAIREQQAAMFAYKGLNYNYKELGSNTAQVGAVMRGLEKDAALATLGVKNLNAAFAAVSQRSTFTEQSRQLLKSLMDFGSAGQSLEQGAKAAGDLIGILQDPNANFSEIKSAAEALGPAMKEALKKAGEQGIDTADEMRKAILSGQLAALGGVTGQFNAVNDTLINRFKGAFGVIRADFADLGGQFLGPLKDGLEEVSTILRRTFMRVRGDIDNFGRGSFVDSFVGAAEKLENAFVKLFREYLPKTQGMFDRMGEWWNDFKRGWDYIVERMRTFVDGARVIEDAFKALIGPIWAAIKESFGTFNVTLLQNRDNFVEFGNQIGEALAKFMEFGAVLKGLFFESLPFVNKVLEGIKQVLGFITDSIKSLKRLIGGLGANDGFGAFLTLASVLMVGNKMKNTKGGFIKQGVGQMSVQAQAVYVNGPTGITPGGQAYGTQPGMPYYMGPGGPGGGMPSRAQMAGSGLASRSQQNLYKSYMAQGMSPLQAQKAAMSAQGYRASRAAGMTRYQSMKNYMNMGYMPMPGGPQPGIMGRMGAPFRAARMRHPGVGKFQGSMGARMGTGLAMNLASGFMPEEAQGAMALGSTVAMFNPLLGLGVGLGGAAMNSQTAAGGALTGAGAGAAIGTMIAPGIGTAVGAVLGGIAGGIMGAFGKKKAEIKKAKAAAVDIATSLVENTLSGFMGVIEKYGRSGATISRMRQAGNVDAMSNLLASTQTALAGDKIDKEAQVSQIFRSAASMGLDMPTTLEDAMKRPEEFLKEFVSTATPQQAAFTTILDKASNRMDYLTKSFRMTEEEILVLAESMGVNLYSATADFNDMVQTLASGLVSSVDDFNNVYADFLGQQLTAMDSFTKAAQAPILLDQISRDAREKILGGGFGSAEAGQFMQDTMGALTDAYGGNAFLASNAFNELFVKGAAFNQAGGVLEGLGGAFYGNADVAGMLQGFGTGFAELSGTPQALLENALKSRGLEAKGLAEGALSGLNAYGVEALTGLIGRTDFATMSADQITAELDKIGITLTNGITPIVTPMETAAISMADAAKSLGIAADQMEAFTTAWNQFTATTGGPNGDTSKPVFNNLKSTLASHNSLSSMVGGNRVVTSSYRNFALGSMNSDHINGRAVDVVGSNLSSYANVVNSSGGFAEFHGSGKGRHVHAVPPPMGDTANPRGMSENTTQNFTLNVYGGANADSKEVAQLVMAEIQRVQRSNSERK